MTAERLQLSRVDGVGPVNYRRLVDRYGSAGAALAALPELARNAGREPPVIPDVRAEMDRVARLGGRLMFLDDADYPKLLTALDASPPVLTVLGDPALLGVRSVAVVGARNASANGQRIAEVLAADLALGGLAVVSGMARGIDAAAHRGAMRTGRTIACVAGGVDVPFPPENAALQEKVAANGAVVSSAPLGTAAQARHFPKRNRLIAGLSLGCVVVEAAPKSGSLMTARMAQEASRELFAVPGSPLDPRCRGSNDLIRSDGAMLTENASDVMAGLAERMLVDDMAAGRIRGSALAEPPAPFQDLDVIRFRLLDLVGPEAVPVDEVLRRCHFSPSAVLGVLQELEVDGTVQRLGGSVCRIVE